jgi:hypothetical protein
LYKWYGFEIYSEFFSQLEKKPGNQEGGGEVIIG